MRIKEVLKQLNIKENKADIYLLCLEMGGATAYSISKKAGLKRPTVYDILNQLAREGLVYKSLKKGTQYFYPSDPEKLLRQLKEKEHKIISIMPILQNLYNSPKVKPSIRYFEGKEGIKEMYEDSLKVLKKGDEILAYVGDDVLGYIPEYADNYVTRRIGKGIKLRGIYKKSLKTSIYMQKNRKQLREAKIIDEKMFPVNNETNIYGNKVAIASYGNEMFGMIIESVEIARSQKAIFELAWAGVAKYGL